LANHDWIYQRFDVDCRTKSYSSAHMAFLSHLSGRLQRCSSLQV
jgi:hypothetical protein